MVLRCQYRRRHSSGVKGRPRRVLVRRHGLDGREPATLAELGEELGVSRERVRQLQRAAEEDLKAAVAGGRTEPTSLVPSRGAGEPAKMLAQR